MNGGQRLGTVGNDRTQARSESARQNGSANVIQVLPDRRNLPMGEQARNTEYSVYVRLVQPQGRQTDIAECDTPNVTH